MHTPSLPLSAASAERPRRPARRLARLALALVALAAAGYFGVAQATYPGENGVILFESTEGNKDYIINRVTPNDNQVTFLTDGHFPRASPSGTKVAFLDNKGNVCVMNIDGSKIVQLTTDGRAWSVAWLPDGSRLAYVKRAGELDDKAELWTMKPDGTGQTFMRTLMDTSVGIGNVNLAWSPWGNTYTFNRKEGLFLFDQVNPYDLLLSKTGEESSWAPDGLSILFVDPSHNQWEINRRTFDLREVPPSNSISRNVYAISPDGKSIAGSSYLKNEQLTTRARAGLPLTFTWFSTEAFGTDWSRIPKNCEERSTRSSGKVLAGDVDFYAEQCAIALMPEATRFLAQAIAVGPMGRLYHRLLVTDPFGGTPTWSTARIVPGINGNPSGVDPKKIAIAASKDGSVQVVIINADDDVVYHALRSADGTWSGFNRLDGAGGAPSFQARDVAITINASSNNSPGNAQIVANGLADGGLFHRVRWAAGNWTPFAPVPSPPGMKTRELAIAASEDGNADVLVTTSATDGRYGSILHTLRRVDGSWNGWEAVGIPENITLSGSTDLAVARTLGGTAQVLFTDSSNNAYFQERPTPNLGEAWVRQVPNVQINYQRSRAVSISAGATADSSSLVITRTYPQ